MKMDDHPEYKKEEYVTELSKKTLGSYVKKASSDAADRSFDHGASEKRQYEPDADDEKETSKLANRQKGIKRAVNRLTKEAMDPVGKEDGDVNNDGKKDDTDDYLMKRRKAIGAAMKKKLKEERASLSEVMTDDEDEKEIKEKKVKNTVKINPNLGEAVEEIGGTLIEQIEVDEMEVVVQEAYDELIEEGYSEDDVEFGIEKALSTIDEASDSYYDDAVKAGKQKRSMKDRLKSAAKKAIGGVARAAGKAMKAKAAVQAAPDKAKAKVKSLADRVKNVAKAGYESGRGPVEPKTTAYRGAGAGRKEKVTEANQGPSTPVKMYDGKMMPNSGAGRIKNVRPKPGLRLAHTEHEGEDIQEINVKGALDSGARMMNTSPAGRMIKKILKPANPGRGTARPAPGAKPGMSGGGATTRPMMNSFEPDGDLVDENVGTGKAKRAKMGGIAQKVGAGEVVSNKERDAAYAKKKAADTASDTAAGDAAHKAATDKGMSPAEAMMRKKAAERKAARERARAMK